MPSSSIATPSASTWPRSTSRSQRRSADGAATSPPKAQERLARAQHLLRLASDSGATPQERQSAYARAQKELDGLIVLPATTRASIERKIAGEIEA